MGFNLHRAAPPDRNHRNRSRCDGRLQSPRRLYAVEEALRTSQLIEAPYQRLLYALFVQLMCSVKSWVMRKLNSDEQRHNGTFVIDRFDIGRFPSSWTRRQFIGSSQQRNVQRLRAVKWFQIRFVSALKVFCRRTNHSRLVESRHLNQSYEVDHVVRSIICDRLHNMICSRFKGLHHYTAEISNSMLAKHCRRCQIL